MSSYKKGRNNMRNESNKIYGIETPYRGSKGAFSVLGGGAVQPT